MDKEKVIEILKTIKDPELDRDIYTLELIREIKMGDRITIIMTLTSPMCPFGPQIINSVVQGVSKGMNKEVSVDLTFNPPWEPSADLREELMSGH